MDPLDGIENNPFESYSGFITVRPETESHMFFWFTPATVSNVKFYCFIAFTNIVYLSQDVDPTQAPVVIWLQGGPGASSLFGLLELHGPIQAVGFNPTLAVPNNYTWNRQANMLYIDNPIGAGEFIERGRQSKYNIRMSSQVTATPWTLIMVCPQHSSKWERY